MLRFLPVAVAVVASLAYGVADGVWTNRWGMDAAIEAAVARLKALPPGVGPWKSEEMELPAGQLRTAEAGGALVRHYENSRTGQRLQVLLICGHPGPLSLHTPEDCYPRQGYARVGKAMRVNIPGDTGNPAAQLHLAHFQKSGEITAPLRISWGWSNGQGWQAPGSARLSFTRSRVLYKLYVIEDMSKVNDPNDQGPLVSFLQQLLPQLQEHLFPAE